MNLKLNKALVEAICRTIRTGNRIEIAAQFAGVPPFILRQWLERGNDEVFRLRAVGQEPDPEEEIYTHLLFEVARANAHAETLLTAQLTKASRDGDVGATKFMLQERFGWGTGAVKRARVEVPGLNAPPRALPEE